MRHSYITLSQDWAPKNVLELSILFLRRFMILQYKRLFVLSDERQISLNALRGGKRCNLRSCFSCIEDFYMWPTYEPLQGFFQVINLIHVGKTPGLSLPSIPPPPKKKGERYNNEININTIYRLFSKWNILNNIIIKK